MKKIGLIISILTFSGLVLAPTAHAASASLTTSKTAVSVGESFEVYANVADVAAWNVHVQASGPVSGCTLAVANATEDAKNATQSFSASCVATGEGVITLVLSGDATDENFNSIGLSGSTAVTVAPAPEPVAPTPSEPEPTVSEPTPSPSANVAAVAPVAANTNSTSDPEASSAAETESTEGLTFEEIAEDTEEEAEETKEEEEGRKTVIVASGSTDSRIKKASVIALAVIATMIACIEIYLMIAARRKKQAQQKIASVNQKALKENKPLLMQAATIAMLATKSGGKK